jgi:hypothetical protein
MNTTCLLRTVGLATLAALLAGCGGSSRPVTMDAWRSSVRKFADDQGNADTASLRDQAAGGAGFAVTGAKSPDESTDVAGVLVGRRPAQGRDWLVFLVGAVTKRQVTDIHVAMMSDAPGKPQWREGASDPVSLKTYRDAGISKYRTPDAKGKQSPQPEWFPREQDAFTLEVSDDRVTVTDRNSGAKWVLSLASPPDAR